MGAWNYGESSNICTLGYYDLDCPEFTEEEIQDEYEANAEFMGEEYTLEHAKHDLEEQFYEYINDCFKDCKFVLENQNFEHWKVSVEGGYYQGFWVNISQETLCVYDEEERLQIHKELTQIRAKLRHCIREFGLRVHYPGWVVKWEETMEKSLDKLQECIKEERKKVKKLPLFDPKNPLKHLKQ